MSMMISGCNPLKTTATANSIRCQVFQPTRRPVSTKGEIIKTSWGTVRVNGRLGQGHADVLDAILYCAQNKRLVGGEAGMQRMQLIVDPHLVRKSACQDSGSTLDAILEDLMQALVTLDVPLRGIKIKGHIIEVIVKSTVTKINPMNGLLRSMWQVTLASTWVKLLTEDIPVYYDPAMISQLPHGISQAISRHVFSHQFVPIGGWKLDDLIKSVGGQGRLRERRAEVMADAQFLGEMGIIVSNGRVYKSERALKSTGSAGKSTGSACKSTGPRP
jgi:hypothetical protein